MASLRTVARRTTIVTTTRCIHTRVPLPYNIDQGLDPFLSPNALRTIAVDWQQGVLTRLNELVRGTDVDNLNVLQTVKQTATDPAKALAFNYASEALNNSFFLSTLSPTPSAPSPNSALSHKIASSSLRSLPGLISHFSAHVAGLHPSSGSYVWLVTDSKGELGVMGTYAGGTPLVAQRRQIKGLAPSVLGEVMDVPEAQSPSAEGAATAAATAAEATPEWTTISSKKQQQPNSNKKSLPRTATSGLLDNVMRPADVSAALRSRGQIGQALHPLLALSVHPHCYLEDYGVWGREEYVRNWWSAVDWRKVEESFAGYVDK